MTVQNTTASRKYLFVRVLEACNADCFMCSFALSRDRYRTSPESFRHILSEAITMNVGFVRFTGGEPLMHRDILELIQICTDAGVKSSLITNGHTLAHHALGLEAAGLDQVIVSLDSGDAELHNKYRNTPSLFERAIEGVDEIRRFGMRVRCNSVVGPHNYTSMPVLQEQLQRHDVEQWELSAIKLSSTIRYDHPDDVRAIGDVIYAGDGPIPMGKRWYGDTLEEQEQYFEQGVPPRATTPVCHVTEDVMYLDPKNGFLFPCSLLPHRSVPHLYGGQIKREDGSFDLHSEAFAERREFFRVNGPKLCTGCSSSAAGYSSDRSESPSLIDWAY